MLKKLAETLFNSLSEFRVGAVMVAVCFIVFFSNFSFLQILSQKIFDLNFTMRGRVEAPRDVVIVAIDQKSQDVFGRWPWSREVMVDLVERLTQFNPRVIGMDMVFSYPEKRPDLILAGKIRDRLERKGGYDPALYRMVEQEAEQADVDGQLARALEKAGNTVPGYFFLTLRDEVEPLEMDIDADYRIIRSHRYRRIKYPESGKRDFVVKEALGVKPNIEPLTDAAKYTGYFNIFPDQDGVTRRFVNTVKFHGKYFPPAVIQMLSVWYGQPAKLIFEEYGVAGVEVGDRYIPTDEFGRTYINFYGPEGEFPRISVADILGGEISDEELAKRLKDKILIIGATAMGIYDIRHTPFGSSAGVEVEATYIQNVIDNKVLNYAGWFFVFNALSILALGLLLMYVMKKVRLAASGLFAAGLALGFIYFQRYLFVEKLLLLDILYPVMTVALVYAGVGLYKYYVEFREKNFIRGAFGQYLSPAVIQQIIKDPDKLQLGGQRREMTVFFSDVAGFSTISEGLDPEELVHLLNEYLTAMTEIVLAHGGTVDKYEGDAIIAFFGAPLEDPEHAVKCAACICQMQSRLEEMRQTWKEQGKAELRMRIGMNTGNMVVGNMGSRTRMDYTIMGDAVNLAARIEGANKQYGSETMVTHFSYQHCKDRFEFRELDSLRVVGKQEVITVYELLAPKGELDDFRRTTVELFTAAHRYYKARDWGNAIEHFAKALEHDPDDGPSLTYIERCLDFEIKPPPEDWDGVYILKSK